MKVGSKAKDCEVFFRDPVLKFEGFGKRLGNFHPLPCALDGSTPQQAPSFDVSIRGSTPHSSSRRLKATACLRSETSLNAGTAAEYKCETGGQYLATGSDEQHASELDIPSCFESVESVQTRVSRVNAMLPLARHLTLVEHSLTARGGKTALAQSPGLCALWHNQIAAVSPVQLLRVRSPLPNCPIRNIVLTDRDKHLLSELRRASAMALPRCVVSRYATAWAESLEGAMSGHQSWVLLCRYRCRLLLG